MKDMQMRCKHFWKIYKNKDAHENECNTFYCQNCLKEIKKKWSNINEMEDLKDG